MSEVSICNHALAYLGEEPIRALTEASKRATLCRSLYYDTRDSNLSSFDWSFARKTELLQQVSETHIEGPMYQMPTDCLTPLSIYPRGQSRLYFKIMGDKIIIPSWDSTTSSIALYLQYTRREDRTALFSSSFIDIFALDLATRLCLPLTQDKDLLKNMRADLRVLRMENEAEDANRGDEYRFTDEDPNVDTFVNPIEGSAWGSDD